ncbi:MAG: hypothetical protein GY869_29245, partial [Planctomycetes bacterium]|nr:hypothetical protein [Planctomycetota bacterium]
AIDFTNEDIAFIGYTVSSDWSFEGGLFKTTDGGVSWNDVFVAGQPRVDALVIRPDNPNVIYAASQTFWNRVPGQESGMYRSADAGLTWENITGNMGHTFVYSASINPHQPGRIYAGAHGGGVWVGEEILPDVPGDVDDDGDVDNDDVQLLIQGILGLAQLTQAEIMRADVNGDGILDVGDVVLIVNLINTP